LFAPICTTAFLSIEPGADVTVDPFSSHDYFVARDMPVELEFRTAWPQKRGIWDEPAGAAFGNAVLREIK
jgi:hypothetical protein